MNREIHVRFCEGLRVRFPWATHLRLCQNAIFDPLKSLIRLARMSEMKRYLGQPTNHPSGA